MAKKKEETTVKKSKETKTNSAEKTATKKATTKKTNAKTKTNAKVTKITKEQTDKKASAVPDEKQNPEKSMAASCQEMMSSIIQ